MSCRTRLPNHIKPSYALEYLSALEGVETASVLWAQGELKAFVVLSSYASYGEKQLRSDIAKLYGEQHAPKEIHFSGTYAVARVA